jgi:hypothetical protein
MVKSLTHSNYHFTNASRGTTEGSTKFQAPTSREAPNFNLQSKSEAADLVFGVWNFSGALEVGAWSFILSAPDHAAQI